MGVSEGCCPPPLPDRWIKGQSAESPVDIKFNMVPPFRKRIRRAHPPQLNAVSLNVTS